MSLIDTKTGGGGIGNYKGVMLCNRPFGGVSGATKANEIPTKAFGCGVVPEEIGAHVSLASKEKHKIKRPKKESALTKHRKWLAELQATKDRLEEEFLNELDQKQQAKEKFRKQEKALRDSSRNILHGADAKDEASKSPDSKPKKSKKKPAWAKPEKKDETEDELAELVGGMENDEELGDLLDFAQNLDYEKYMNDMEIKTMMAQVKKRISDLENNINQDEKRSNDMEVERARREIMALKELSKGPQYDEGEYEEDEDEVALEAAKELLSKNEDIKSVHSTKSASVLFKNAKEKEGKEPKVFNEPIIAVHDPNEGTRLDADAKNAVSNMPYMHRNPAI